MEKTFSPYSPGNCLWICPTLVSPNIIKNIPDYDNNLPVNIFEQIGCWEKDFVMALGRYWRGSFKQGLLCRGVTFRKFYKAYFLYAKYFSTFTTINLTPSLKTIVTKCYRKGSSWRLQRFIFMKTNSTCVSLEDRGKEISEDD